MREEKWDEGRLAHIRDLIDEQVTESDDTIALAAAVISESCAARAVNRTYQTPEKVREHLLFRGLS